MRPKPSEFEDQVIRLAWADRISFEEIKKRSSLSESEVIELMRRFLRPKSFQVWRRRVSGRITKHRKRFEQKIVKSRRAGKNDLRTYRHQNL
ncbi:MAG: TIGR03643 family protein [Puniceicoccaceae bacterium]